MDNSSGRPDRGDSTPGTPVYRWGPDRRLRWICLAAAVAAIAWGFVGSDAEDRLVARVVAVVFLVLTLLFVRVRVRLAADAGGMTASGPFRRRSLTWPDVVSITAPRRGRFGRRSASLEVEYSIGDDADPQLLAFSSLELGMDPERVARTLVRLRSAAR